MKKLIFFDLDGTIVDTRQDIIASVNHMSQVLGGQPIGDAEIKSYVGKGLKHLVQSALKTEDEKRISRGSEIYRKHYQAHMLDHTRLYRGTFDVLDYLKTRILYVFTNKPDPFSTEILRALGVSSYFKGVIAGDSPFPKKPDPKAIIETMTIHNIEAGHTLLIGDSAIDIETAKNAGIESVMLTHGFSAREELEAAGCPQLLDNMKELLDLAKKMGW